MIVMIVTNSFWLDLRSVLQEGIQGWLLKPSQKAVYGVVLGPSEEDIAVILLNGPGIPVKLPP